MVSADATPDGAVSFAINSFAARDTMTSKAISPLFDCVFRTRFTCGQSEGRGNAAEQAWMSFAP
jgi:hypothetical protein